jgi:hypothetical protein
MSEPISKFEFPESLTALSDAECVELEEKVKAEFDRINAMDVAPELIQYQIELTQMHKKVSAENHGRELRAAELAEAEKQQLRDQRDLLVAHIEGQAAPTPTVVTERLEAVAQVDPQAIAEATAKGTAAAMLAVMGDRMNRLAGGTHMQVVDRAQASLQAAAELQPREQRPDNRASEAEVTLNIGIPGLPAGSRLASQADVAKAFEQAAQGMYPTHNGFGNPSKVVSVKRRFDMTMDDRTKPGELMAYLEHLRDESDEGHALVAGGGWCAPSLPIYDFFNVAESDGLVDLPTVGVTRGGLQIPVSPSLADAVYTIGGASGQGFPGFAGPAGMTNATDPFLWSETDDIATVTGTPNKPTMRVPCPTYNNVRLEVYGVQLTAGNLTNDAFPEATQNTIRLLNAAWAHAQNARIIASMVALSTAAITISGGANRPAFNQILSGLDLAGVDYRAKFGMSDESVLEVVLPYWVRDVIIADLAYRTNVDLLSISNQQVDGYFADRGLRAQFVNDWQVRQSNQFGQPAANLTAWPTQANAMLYAPGTFLKGNGLTLDLGVVRDSVLNAENDYTAVFSEEAHLVAKVGHESRLYTIGFSVNGAGVAAQVAGAYI